MLTFTKVLVSSETVNEVFGHGSSFNNFNLMFMNWLQMWDASTGEAFAQFTEHKKRAWSVDFSRADPTMFASGSDDCSVRLWSVNDV